jgi:hypothetical protein
MSDEHKKEEGKGFTVQDRRRFSSDTGEPRDPTSEEPSRSQKADSDRSVDDVASQRQSSEEPLPEINFSTFVISLSTQVLMNLGEIPNPLTNAPEKDIPVAKQMIDILAMLQEKTRGNLNAGESKLMEEILFDLRMKYVEAVKQR